MSAETLQFKTELKQLLHIIVHSLYSHKDIFLRELISNASDAIDTARFQSLTDHAMLEGNGEWKIKIVPDEKNRTLTVADNGVGMSRESIVENLGTIAKSGTRAFLESLRQSDAKNRPELIGQFGVGFYSSFMVADRVTVVSRMAGEAKNGVKWESNGEGEFSVEPFDKETRGTDVILHLREDAAEFLNVWRIRELVKKYSDFVEHPIVMDVEKEDEKKNKTIAEETINSQKALWLRSRSEITPEDYNAFYQHVSHDSADPAKTIHYSAEGTIEFRALLYIPAHKPFDLMYGEARRGLQLYIQRVFIMDDCKALLPLYLRFVRGVVDSPDLPLNVSREMLQQSAPLEKIRSNLVNKLLNTLAEMKKDEYDAYVHFYEELGDLIKEGIVQDWSNRARIADLLLFESTKTEPGKFTSLESYVEKMKDDQKEIYYLIGDSRQLVEHSPYVEAFKANDREVLLLTDPIDEFVVQHLTEYKGKKLKAADKGSIDQTPVPDATKKSFQPLLDYMKERLGEVKEVRLSGRLKDSAACLVADEGEIGADLERMIQRMGKGHELTPAKRILELNPDHAAVQAMQKLFDRDAGDHRLESYSRLLYDLAVIAEGSKVHDPAAFAQRVSQLLVHDAG